MSTATAQPARKMLDGTVRIFLAEALFVPTGLITAAFLTRRLGAEGYGFFALVGMIVAWLEWAGASLFSRATVKFISEADHWQPVANTVVRLHLLVGGIGAVTLCLLAKPIAALLHEPVLAKYLWLFAIQIPISALVLAHRNVLVGTGEFRSQAQASTARWIARLALIVLFVEMGLSVPGAILGSIGAIAAELAVARFYVRPSLWGRSDFPARRLLAVVAPLFLFAACMRLSERMDLLLLKVLGGSAKDAGIYGAAQNLSLAPGLFAIAFSPLLLSTLSRMIRNGEVDGAKRLGGQAMRAVVVLLPFAAAIAGAGREVALAIFGREFTQTGPLLALLVFGAVAQVMTSVVAAILLAAGRPGLAFAVVVPLVPLSIIAHLMVIPRYGPIGAASVTLAWASAAAVATGVGIYSQWRIFPPIATVGRSILLSLAAYGLAVWWPVVGLLVFVKLLAIGLVVVMAYLLLGEVNRREFALARSILPWPVPPSAPHPGDD